jgi:hypothetical protein
VGEAFLFVLGSVGVFLARKHFLKARMAREKPQVR